MPNKPTTKAAREWMEGQSEKDLKLAMSDKDLDVSTSSKAVTLRSVKDSEVAQIRNKVQSMGKKAVDYLEVFLDDKKAPRASKAKTALEILKIGGHTVGGRDTGGGVNLNIPDDTFMRIMRIGQDIVDVEAVESNAER